MGQRGFINSGQRNTKTLTFNHCIVKLLKEKTLRKILKAEKEK